VTRRSTGALCGSCPRTSTATTASGWSSSSTSTTRPFHTGFSAGYYDAIVGFFRNFLSGGLKDNPHLWKSVLTGILRIAKESISSGLNNLSVFSMLRPSFSTSFGFTPDEVASLARAVGREAALPEITR
jgi:hypothetical protein